MVRNRYTPDCVTPPGFFLGEKLDEIGMALEELATQTGYPTNLLKELIAGRVGIDHDLALKLESVLGIPARFWVNAEWQCLARRAGHGDGCA